MKLKYDQLLSHFAFNFNLRHYNVEGFLMIPDDGLLLPWKLSALPADAVWSLAGKFEDPFVDPGGAVQVHPGYPVVFAVVAVDPALAFKR